MVSDPISDLLVRIQNASLVRHERVIMPSSRLKAAVAATLKKGGYINEFDTDKTAHTLKLTLSYSNGKPAISGFKRISKPSRRLYYSVNDIKPVKRGNGLLVLSTPAGVLSGKEARMQKVGGEALFEIW